MILSHLLSAKVTSILRGISEQQVLPTVSALYEGGSRFGGDYLQYSRRRSND